MEYRTIKKTNTYIQIETKNLNVTSLNYILQTMNQNHFFQDSLSLTLHSTNLSKTYHQKIKKQNSTHRDGKEETGQLSDKNE